MVASELAWFGKANRRAGSGGFDWSYEDKSVRARVETVLKIASDDTGILSVSF